MSAASPIREQHKRELAVEVLQNSGQVRLAARGFSMLPSLWPGDVLTIHAASLEDLDVGDIGFFQREDGFSIHRVQERTTMNGVTCLITRGDSMTQCDRPIGVKEVLGEVVAVERDGQVLPRVPECTWLSRCVGVTLGSWDRLRSVVLRWRRRTPALGTEPDGMVPL